MKLGLKRDEVRLAPYNEEWQKEFERVKKELVGSGVFQEEQVEHIGSTAIRGMDAKPIVDILAGVQEIGQVDKSLFQKLSSLGFLQLKVQRPDEIILAKFTDDTYQEKTHFLHLVTYQGELWKDLLFFRDYLNAEKEARKQYLRIKHRYVQKHATGIKDYTDSKEAFVKEIVLKQKRTEQEKNNRVY